MSLNASRAAEEAAGTVRWLRPDFLQRGMAGAQSTMGVSTDEPEAVAVPAAPATKRPWPTGLPEQIKAVADVLTTSASPLARVRRPQAGVDRWQAA